MRWISKIPKCGQTRIIKRFLLFPRLVNHEWRWLEIAYILQEWCFGWEDKDWSNRDKFYAKKKLS